MKKYSAWGLKNIFYFFKDLKNIIFSQSKFHENRSTRKKVDFHWFSAVRTLPMGSWVPHMPNSEYILFIFREKNDLKDFSLLSFGVILTFCEMTKHFWLPKNVQIFFVAPNAYFFNFLKWTSYCRYSSKTWRDFGGRLR